MDLTKIMIDKEKCKVRNAANTIAEMYLQKFPRSASYGIELSTGSVIPVPYDSFTEKELDALHKSQELIKAAKWLTIIDGLYHKSHKEPQDKLVHKLYNLAGIDRYSFSDLIKTVDLSESKFSMFSVRELQNDGTLGEKHYFNVPLSDEEYKEILTELIYYSNVYSVNMLIYNKPALGQKIMKYLTFASCTQEHESQFHRLITGENPNPFIVEMPELKSVCESILNPFVDKLGLFTCNNENLKSVAIKQQIIPGYNGEYMICYVLDHHTSYQYDASIKFLGTDIMFYDQKMQHSDFIGLDHFTVNSYDVMKRFSLDEPKDIMPYLKAHYQGKDVLKQIRKDLDGLKFKDDWSLIPFEERLREIDDITQKKIDDCLAEANHRRADPSYEEEDFDITEWGVDADEFLATMKDKYLGKTNSNNEK